jgi:hypothetical protein
MKAATFGYKEKAQEDQAGVHDHDPLLSMPAWVEISALPAHQLRSTAAARPFCGAA